jgi:curli production assembly/transport component CsgG
LSLLALSACSQIPVTPPTVVKPAASRADAVLTPGNRVTRELVRLPDPRYRIPVGVYAFRDMSGQFKPQPDSNLSNAVTQGAAALLVKALLDSNWFIPIEREGLQNLLTERRIARAIENPGEQSRAQVNYPQLVPAWFIIEGGITGYEQNVRTGGEGANLLGIGADIKYQIDQVTVNLRSVDVRSGQVVNSVLVTKTIYSHSLNGSMYGYVAYKKLLQAEGGFSANEPSQLAVKEAIESAVMHLIVQGARDKAWFLRNEAEWSNPTVQALLREADGGLLGSPDEKLPPPSPRPANVMILPTPQPQSARPAATTTAAPATPAAAPAAPGAPGVSATPPARAPVPAGATASVPAAQTPVPTPTAPEAKKADADKPPVPVNFTPNVPNSREPAETPSTPVNPLGLDADEAEVAPTEPAKNNAANLATVQTKEQAEAFAKAQAEAAMQAQAQAEAAAKAQAEAAAKVQAAKAEALAKAQAQAAAKAQVEAAAKAQAEAAAKVQAEAAAKAQVEAAAKAQVEAAAKAQAEAAAKSQAEAAAKAQAEATAKAQAEAAVQAEARRITLGSPSGALPSGPVSLQAGLRAAQAGDFLMARYHFQLLAAQGNAAAQYNLGVMYANGLGVPQSDAMARDWLAKAAAQNYPQAPAALEKLKQP